MINLKKFSEKQRKVLSWWNPTSDEKNKIGIICDGSVRSGKTFSIGLSFILWSFFYFDGADFAICGKTKTSLSRNLLRPIFTFLEGNKVCTVSEKRNEYADITIDGRTNRFYFFGGKDESSASLIQGITLAGVLFDEVALMPRSFVEQAIARCSVEGAKFWFSCNPEHPNHWFYREWISQSEKKNVLYLHFTMKDNPSLSEEVRERYENLYSGVFYRRFVLGEWCVSDGLVYPFFDKDIHVVKKSDKIAYEKYYVSCDYGTINPTSIGLWGLSSGVWYRIDEYYFDSRAEGNMRTDSEHLDGLLSLIGDREIEAIIIDPSAASFKELIRRSGKYKIINAKNDIINGIRKVSEALKNGDILFCESCKNSIREFSLYRYDTAKLDDKPLKENDHAMDEIRYFVSTVLNQKNSGDNFFAFSIERR